MNISTRRKPRLLSTLLAMGSLLALGSNACAAGNGGDSARRTRPNIVFILADDLGWSELGCYGNRFNETPNLDRLAARGMRFTRAYAAAPVCSPTRAALMTGQHPARVGITDYLDKNDEHFLSPGYVTLNERLKSAGYATGLIGKWHLTGDYGKGRGAPQRHDWDEVLCSETKYIADGDYFHPYFFMPEVAAREPNEYLTDRLNREATDFIRRHKGAPFFLYLSHYAVHTKLSARPELLAKYAQKTGAGQDRNNPELAAMLEDVDAGVGRIVRTLDELGLSDDTLIVFTSDNGGALRVTKNTPLRAGKGTLYEGGIRAPLIVTWPSRINPGVACDTPVITTDFYPTFLEIAGVRPEDKQPVDGVSLAPLFARHGSLRRESLFWHYPRAGTSPLVGRSAGAVRNGDYKLIEFHDTGATELYDLRRDAGETQNLAAAMPDKVSDLRQRLDNWRKAVGASREPMRRRRGHSPEE